MAYRTNSLLDTSRHGRISAERHVADDIPNMWEGGDGSISQGVDDLLGGRDRWFRSPLWGGSRPRIPANAFPTCASCSVQTGIPWIKLTVGEGSGVALPGRQVGPQAQLL